MNKNEEKVFNENDVHKERHLKLHAALDELLADYINYTGRLLSETTALDLMEWSYQQAILPSDVN